MIMKIITSIFLLICTSLFIYVTLNQLDAVLTAFSSTSLCYWFIGISLATSMLLVRFYKWLILVRSEGVEGKLSVLFKVYLSGLAFTFTPGKVGENYRNRYLKALGLNNTTSVNIFVIERCTDLLGVILLCIVGSLFAETHLFITFLSSFAFVTLFLLITLGGSILIKFIYLIPVKYKYKKSLEKYSKIFSCNHSLKKITLLVAISFVIWSIPSVMLFVLVVSDFKQFTLGQAVLANNIATILGVLSILPAGIGIYEGSIYLSLSEFKVPSGLAVFSVFFLRSLFLFWSIVVGVWAIFSLRKHF